VLVTIRSEHVGSVRQSSLPIINACWRKHRMHLQSQQAYAYNSLDMRLQPVLTQTLPAVHFLLLFCRGSSLG
jgi:hypothetical protein